MDDHKQHPELPKPGVDISEDFISGCEPVVISRAEALENGTRQIMSQLDLFFDENKAFLAKTYLKYLEKHKPLDIKRKDDITPDLDHEVTLAFHAKSFLMAKLLPTHVTYSVDDDGQKTEIPEAAQSIERFLGAFLLHDIFEDCPDATYEEFKEFVHKELDQMDGISKSRRARLNATIEEDIKTAAVLTDGKKARDPQTGKPITIQTYTCKEEYAIACQDDWIAAPLKIRDRVSSLCTRYGEVADFMTISKDISHLAETKRLFLDEDKNGMTYADKIAKRYPQMRTYILDQQANLDTAFKCLAAFTMAHPTTNRMLHAPEYTEEGKKGTKVFSAEEREILKMQLEEISQVDTQLEDLLRDIKYPDFHAADAEVIFRREFLDAGINAKHVPHEVRMMENLINQMLKESERGGRESLKHLAEDFYEQYSTHTPKCNRAIISFMHLDKPENAPKKDHDNGVHAE